LHPLTFPAISWPTWRKMLNQQIKPHFHPMFQQRPGCVKNQAKAHIWHTFSGNHQQNYHRLTLPLTPPKAPSRHPAAAPPGTPYHRIYRRLTAISSPSNGLTTAQRPAELPATAFSTIAIHHRQMRSLRQP